MPVVAWRWMATLMRSSMSRRESSPCCCISSSSWRSEIQRIERF
jgi:hypothetical protein